MKLTAKLFGMVAVMVLASSAHATDIRASIGSWKGGGAVFGKDGKQTGTFEVTLQNSQSSTHEMITEGIITLPDGTTKTFWQKTIGIPGSNAFTIETAEAKGRGYCLGEGICTAYVGTEAEGSALSIIFDGETGMRILATGLKDGMVQYFVREKLTKVSK
jgi:hypothetical protein